MRVALELDPSPGSPWVLVYMDAVPPQHLPSMLISPGVKSVSFLFHKGSMCFLFLPERLSSDMPFGGSTSKQPYTVSIASLSSCGSSSWSLEMRFLIWFRCLLCSNFESWMMYVTWPTLCKVVLWFFLCVFFVSFSHFFCMSLDDHFFLLHVLQNSFLSIFSFFLSRFFNFIFIPLTVICLSIYLYFSSIIIIETTLWHHLWNIFVCFVYLFIVFLSFNVAGLYRRLRH